MKPNSVDVVLASYRRCCEKPDFLTAFYAYLFEASPEAKLRFANTDFTRQHQLIKHGLGLLFNFNRHSEAEPNILTRVAERHSRGDLSVDPKLYPVFLDSLIATARQYDPDFDAETEVAWREATAKGIAYMSSKY